MLRIKHPYAFCNLTKSFTTMIKQKGDTVFMNSLNTKNTWQILYNYAALAGHTWTTDITSVSNFNTLKTYTVLVNSVNTITVNNFILRVLNVNYLSSDNITVPNLQIIERYGCNYYMFNYKNPDATPSMHCDGPNKFLCYQDSVFGLKQFSSFPCDFENPVALAHNKYIVSSIQVCPNPFNEYITIKTEAESLINESHLTLSDLSGRVVKNEKISMFQQSFDLKELKSGIYFLTISRDWELLYKGKIVKD